MWGSDCELRYTRYIREWEVLVVGWMWTHYMCTKWDVYRIETGKSSSSLLSECCYVSAIAVIVVYMWGEEKDRFYVEKMELDLICFIYAWNCFNFSALLFSFLFFRWVGTRAFLLFFAFRLLLTLPPSLSLDISVEKFAQSWEKIRIACVEIVETHFLFSMPQHHDADDDCMGNVLNSTSIKRAQDTEYFLAECFWSFWARFHPIVKV